MTGHHENVGFAVIGEALAMQLEELIKGNRWQSACVEKEDVTERGRSI